MCFGSCDENFYPVNAKALDIFVLFINAFREAIKEDDDGLLESNVADIIARAKRKRAALRASGAIKLGMMRHLFVIIDSSECMSLQDLKPTRYLCVLKLLEIFIDEFFDLNPISQLALLATKSKRCDRVTELSGNKKKHLEVGSGFVNPEYYE